MVANTDLPSHNHIVFHDNTAGEPGLRCNDNIFTHLAVVSNVDQVIDLRPATDASGIQSPSINRRIRSDLYIILDLQCANLGKLLIASGGRIRHIAKAIAAQHSSGMNDDTISQSRAGIDRHICDQVAVVADHDAGLQATAGSNMRPGANNHTFSDDNQSFDRYAWA